MAKAKLKWSPSHKTKIFIGLIILIVVLFFLFQYFSYRYGNRTLVFGSKESYNQNQTLHLYNLDVWVTNTRFKDIPEPQKPDLSNCDIRSESQYLQDTGPTGYKSIFGVSFCPSIMDTYNYELNISKNSRDYRVDFWYKNVSNHPINMSNYHFKLVANTDLGVGYCDIRSGTLLEKSALYSCAYSYIPKSYTGPLSLLVSSGGTQKEIHLNK